ncbi:purine nucleoside phosphorylase-like, partial [Notothenia coriiceps]|uniref:purine-nucleoside phosphorylase n=1 Tax=Notothenia coriiceps TaxID=8208 RepID=A0A6I9NMB9_9TELE
TFVNILSSTYSYEEYKETADWLLAHTEQRPKVAIICGSGLGGLGELLGDRNVFQYKDIPHFPTSTVPGHAGQLVFGKLQGRECVCMQGRFHFYEGYNIQTVSYSHCCNCLVLFIRKAKTVFLLEMSCMSTVPEVLVARHCGLRILGLSLITNKVVTEYDSTERANHEEVLKTTERRTLDLQRLVSHLITKI